MSKHYFLLILNLLFASLALAQVCLTKSSKYPTTVVLRQGMPCRYNVRVYIHRINPLTVSGGYSPSVDNIIMNNLNSSLDSYGLYFQLSGSRTWRDDEIGSNNVPLNTLLELYNNPQNNFQSNAINIYVFRKDNVIASGYVPNANKQVLLLTGTRIVNHCPTSGTIGYEIPTSKVVAHEMGHCLGLPHTFGSGTAGNNDDGFSDTSPDYITGLSGTGQACVNPTTCQFTGKCGECLLASNPTALMTNFMSYTAPNCMSVFSPMQVQAMKDNLEGSLARVVASKAYAPIDLLTNSPIKYDSNPAQTANYISAGTHYLSANLTSSDYQMLVGGINWISSNTSIYWTKSGSYNENVRFDLYSGQSTNFTVTANNGYGTSTRNIAFYVQSAWRLASTQVASTLSVSFDDVSNTETLPQQIEIYDETTNKKEKVINVKQLHKDKAFKDKTLDVNISSITSGSKRLVFHYLKSKNSKGEEQYETKIDKFVRIAPRSEIIEDDHTFRIYPTPVINVLQLELFSKTKKNVVISIFNSLGAAVKQVNLSLETGLNTNSIDVSDLTSGVYFLHSSDSEHILNVLRFVKEEE